MLFGVLAQAMSLEGSFEQRLKPGTNTGMSWHLADVPVLD